MLIERYIRGSRFEWEASFSDADGAVSDPASVTLYVSYIDGSGTRTTEEIEMDADSSGAWTAAWASGVAKKGQVAWSVRASSPDAAQDGVFDLTANLANPDPEVSA